jgi:hypothetical protein
VNHPTVVIELHRTHALKASWRSRSAISRTTEPKAAIRKADRSEPRRGDQAPRAMKPGFSKPGLR